MSQTLFTSQPSNRSSLQTNRNGFVLLEVLLSVLMGAFVLTFTGELLHGSLDVMSHCYEQNEVSIRDLRALSVVRRDVEEALDTRIINGELWCELGTRHWTHYRVNWNHELIRQLTSGGDSVVALHVNSFQVSKLQSLILVTLTMTDGSRLSFTACSIARNQVS
jgi:type II secretory pathway component PulJ